MKERPILFNGDMVRAILSGTKTQTRRLFRAPAWVHSSELPDLIGALNRHGGECARRGPCDGLRHVRSPYGVAGDRLYVRETYGVERPDFDDPSADRIVYAADDGAHPLQRWTPSIHMPREYSRITLEVVSVRLERVSDISDTDARAEGVTPRFDAQIAARIAGGTPHRMEFWSLWGEVYGAESWVRGDWVWAVTFKRVEP